MNTKEEVGRRALAVTKHWRWIPGMQEIDGAICVAVWDGKPWLWGVDGSLVEHEEGDEAIPDMESPATLGCSLALVREACGHPDANACKTSDGRFWGVRCPGSSGYMGTGKTEGESHVATLEKAP